MRITGQWDWAYGSREKNPSNRNIEHGYHESKSGNAPGNTAYAVASSLQHGRRHVEFRQSSYAD
jgi:hypothetical protein